MACRWLKKEYAACPLSPNSQAGPGTGDRAPLRGRGAKNIPKTHETPSPHDYTHSRRPAGRCTLDRSTLHGTPR
eukprot:5673232-Prymnesium_polylepis.1